MKKSLFLLIALLCLFSQAFAQWPSNENSPISVGGGSFNDIALGSLSDDEGGVFIAWSKGSPPNGYYSDTYLSYYDNSGYLKWTKSICALAGSEVFTGLISDGAGGVIIAWQDPRNFNNCVGCHPDVYGQRISKEGEIQWEQNGKQLASSSNGLIPVVSQLLKGSGQEFYLVRSLNGYCYVNYSGGGGGTWTCPVTTDKIVINKFNSEGNNLWSDEKTVYSSAGVNQSFNFSALYDEVYNQIFVVWEDGRNNTFLNNYYGSGGITNFDLYAQAIDGNTGDKLWTPDGVEVCSVVDNSSLGSDKRLNPKILTSGANGLMISWMDYRESAGSYLHGQRLLKSTGQKVWISAPDGRKLSTTALNTEYGSTYSLTTLPNNLFLAAFGSSDKTIIAQKFNLAGSLIWGTNGKIVSDNNNNNVNPIIVDNTDGHLIMWTKHFSYQNETLYAQKLNPDGSSKWAAARKLNSGHGGWGALAISDNSGGAIVSWTDYFNGNTNLEVKLTSISLSGKFKGGITIIPGYANGSKGQEVQIPVTVIDFENILTSQFTIEWDPSVITYTGADAFGLPNLEIGSFGINNIQNGKLTFSWDDVTASGQSLVDNATLFNITFKLIGTPGYSSDISITNSVIPIEVYDSDFEKVNTKVSIGAVYIGAYGLIFNTYYLANNGQVKGGPVKDVDLFVNNIHWSTTDEEGQVIIDFFPDESEGVQTITAAKVDNSKEGVDVADILQLRQHILGTSPFDSPFKMIAADVDQTGVISTIDIAHIRSFILGKQQNFKGRTWVFVNDYKFLDPEMKYNVEVSPFTYLDNMQIDPATQNMEELLSINALNFIGIKLGDIDASWATETSGGRTSQNEELVFTPQYPVLSSANEIQIPVRVENFNKISAFQFTLTWNKEELTFNGVESTLPIVVNNERVQDGLLPILWDHNEAKSISLADGSEVMILKFKKRDVNSTAMIHMGSELTKAVAFNEKLQSVEVKLASDDTKPSPFQVYPIPFGDVLNVKLDQPHNGIFEITIQDSQGREIYIHEDFFTGAAHTVTIDTSSLSHGLYLCKVVAGNEVRLIKIVK